MVKVKIDQGILVGRKNKTLSNFEYVEFLEVPYAKPPIGDLRFKSPQPLEPWEGERDASSINDNHVCYQPDLHTRSAKGSEDCLYLNVYTPKLPTVDSKLLPVMVYFHHGGFMIGTGTAKFDSGPDFLLENGVIMVSVNYRLGIFGFLSLGIPEVTGNMGLKDQVMALKWVQNNINKFGGDSKNVTIFGISAGSAAVEYHLLSSMSDGLFQRVISQSGSTLNPWAFNDNVENASVKTAKELGYQGPLENAQEIFQYFSKLSTETLGSVSLKDFDRFITEGIDFTFLPTIEKQFGNEEAFLTDYPFKLLKEGKFNKVNILKGLCVSEGILASIMKPPAVQKLVKSKQFTDFLGYKLNAVETEELNSKFKQIYTDRTILEDDPDQFATEFFGDVDFISGIWTASNMIAVNEAPVYVYAFSYDGELNYFKKLMMKSPKKGACHGDDIGYIFSVNAPVEMIPTKNDKLTRNRLVKMWTDFAKFGNPTPGISSLIPVVWPRFSYELQQYLKIDKELTVEAKFQPERMALFEKLYEKYQK